MPYSRASLSTMILSDLVKDSMTQSIARPHCDSWASCFDSAHLYTRNAIAARLTMVSEQHWRHYHIISRRPRQTTNFPSRCLLSCIIVTTLYLRNSHYFGDFSITLNTCNILLIYCEIVQMIQISVKFVTCLFTPVSQFLDIIIAYAYFQTYFWLKLVLCNDLFRIFVFRNSFF